MTARERLHLAYELAFHPARLNAAWNDWERGAVNDLDELRQTLDWALCLHQRLPEAPAVSGRALQRLARHQAVSRQYRLPPHAASLPGKARRESNPARRSAAVDGPRHHPPQVWPLRDVGNLRNGARSLPQLTLAIQGLPGTKLGLPVVAGIQPSWQCSVST